METKYKRVIASIPGSIKVVEPSEETRKEAKASLSQLKTLLPAGIDPQDEPALLFVAGNLFVAGMINLNDDGVDIETSLAVYKKFEKQQINLEHDRKAVRGYIIHAGLTEFGTDRVITEDEARAAGKPFNVAVVMALWKTVDKELCGYLTEASSPTHPDFKSLSLSFEVGFEGYRIIGLPLNATTLYEATEISRATLTVEPGEDSFSRYAGCLRDAGGSGLSPDDASLRLYSILDEGVIPLGGGIVTVPAAFVKGVTVITETPNVVSPEAEQANREEQERLEREIQELAEAKQAFASLLENLEQKITPSIISQESRVSPNTPKTPTQMKNIQDLKDAGAKATNVEEFKLAFASAIDLTTVITQESERREQLRKEAAEQATKLEAAKAEAQANADALKADLDKVRKELEDIKSAQASAAAEQKFNERMTALDEVFDLDDETRAFFVEEIKTCESDESFAKKFEKFKKLMPEKTKEEKKKKAERAQATITQYQDALKKANVEAKFNTDTMVLEEVFASAKDNVVSPTIPNIVQPEGDLKAQAQKAFGAGLFIGGKSIDERNSKK